MTREEREQAIAILENEKKCVNRANKNDYCNRDCYNCELVKADTEILTALDMAIQALKQEPCEDAISRAEVLKFLEKEDWADTVEGVLALPPVTLQPRWIPIKWHEITEEEREREGYPEEWICHLDCLMPDDGDEILITVKDSKGRRWVEKDTALIDDGHYLDSGYDWVDDVIAWMPLPEPWKGESEDEESRRYVND